MSAMTQKRVESIRLGTRPAPNQSYKGPDDSVYIEFEDGTRLVLVDNGPLCCNNRYMTTDDDLQSFIGDTFLRWEVSDFKYEEADDHEMQFLRLFFSSGSVLTVETHNAMSGHYGGFDISVWE